MSTADAPREKTLAEFYGVEIPEKIYITDLREKYDQALAELAEAKKEIEKQKLDLYFMTVAKEAAFNHADQGKASSDAVIRELSDALYFYSDNKFKTTGEIGKTYSFLPEDSYHGKASYLIDKHKDAIKKARGE